jgi:hypothetical protein
MSKYVLGLDKVMPILEDLRKEVILSVAGLSGLSCFNLVHSTPS